MQIQEIRASAGIQWGCPSIGVMCTVIEVHGLQAKLQFLDSVSTTVEMRKIGQGWNHQCIMPTPLWPWNNVKVLKSDLFILQLNGGRHCVKNNWHILLNSAHSLGITSSLCSRNTHNYDCNVCALKTGFVLYAITCHQKKNIMNMHAWPRVSEILPASLSTGKSLGLGHLGGLAALFSCSVLSD